MVQVKKYKPNVWALAGVLTWLLLIVSIVLFA
jgi:hypothetical protein